MTALASGDGCGSTGRRGPKKGAERPVCRGSPAGQGVRDPGQQGPDLSSGRRHTRPDPVGPAPAGRSGASAWLSPSATRWYGTAYSPEGQALRAVSYKASDRDTAGSLWKMHWQFGRDPHRTPPHTHTQGARRLGTSFHVLGILSRKTLMSHPHRQNEHTGHSLVDWCISGRWLTGREVHVCLPQPHPDTRGARTAPRPPSRR